jgi:hypothetical protein
MLSNFFRPGQQVQALDTVAGIWFTAIILSLDAWSAIIKWKNFNWKPSTVTVEEEHQDPTLKSRWLIREEVLPRGEVSGKRTAKKPEADVGYKKHKKAAHDEVTF